VHARVWILVTGVGTCSVLVTSASCDTLVVTRGGATTSTSTGTGGAATSTGTKGTGTTATQAVSVGSSQPTTTATVSSSSTGGNTLCEQTCAHFSPCGISCADVGIDCNNVGPSFDCFAACVANAPCNALATTIQACNAACSSTTSSGSSSSSVGGSSSSSAGGPTCTQCTTQFCLGQVQTCALNGNCANWLQCSQACVNATPGDPNCAFACDLQYSTAKAFYQPVYACLCTDCAIACSIVAPCSPHPPPGG